MINPLIQFPVKGAIWYQGENNASRAFQYRKAFPLMITDWRKHWKEGDFHFTLFSWLAIIQGMAIVKMAAHGQN